MGSYLGNLIVGFNGPHPFTEALTGGGHVLNGIWIKVWIVDVAFPDLPNYWSWYIIFIKLPQTIQKM